MSLRNDLTGQRFGRLVAMYQAPNQNGKIRYQCKCDCGNEKNVTYAALAYGQTKSCGCLRSETAAKTMTTHGDTGTKLWRTWHHMRDRCYNPNNSDYKYYGGKGIQICDEWKDDYLAFKSWCLDHGFDENLTIDRIDPDKNYSPDNCQWITHFENVSKAVTDEHVKRLGKYYGISPSGEHFTFDNALQFAKEHELKAVGIGEAANGRKKQYKGWEFGYLTT